MKGIVESLIYPFGKIYIPPVYDIDLPDVPKKLRGYEVKPVRDSKVNPKIQRNDICSCGSGKKFKNCCYEKKE